MASRARVIVLCIVLPLVCIAEREKVQVHKVARSKCAAALEGPDCMCPAEPSVCSMLTVKGDVQAAVKAAIKTKSTSAKVRVNASEFTLERKSMAKTEDAAKKVSNAIRQSLRSPMNETMRALICDIYGANGDKVLSFAKGARAEAFIVTATATAAHVTDQNVMGVSALRQLTEEQLAETYHGTRQSAMNSTVGEVSMVYVDSDCRGMSVSSWTLAAVFEQAKSWGFDELVLQATPGARSLYERVYNFSAHVETKAIGVTPMSLMRGETTFF